MVELTDGQVSQPQRIGAQIQKREGNLLVMPAYLPGSESLAVKLVSIFPHNHDLGIPSHQALIAVFDAETGAPAAIMDGEHITAMRTAAGSALATRLLARDESNVLAILGTGVQASAHAVAIPRVRPITEIRIAGRNADRARAMAVAYSVELGIPAEGTDSFEEAVAGADIISACTHADSPSCLWLKWLDDGVHVNSVGLNFQGTRTRRGSRPLFKGVRGVPTRPPLHRLPPEQTTSPGPSATALLTKTHVLAEIGELVKGTHPGRTSDDEITLYKSVGVAAQDAVAARMVLAAAIERGVGLNIEM